MFEKLTKAVTRFFGIIAGSLTGLGAILTAVGYLAERSHLAMLGFTSIPVDLNQYLYTGALFFAGLPGLLLLLTTSMLFDLWVIIPLFLFILWLFSMRNHKMKQLNDTLKEKLKTLIFSNSVAFLSLLMIVQLVSVSWLTQALDIKNVLFEDNIAAPSQSISFVKTDPEILKQLILYKSDHILQLYFCQLFLIILVTAVILRMIIVLLRPKKTSQSPLVYNIVLTLNLVLLTTQVLLLPINFGVLLLDKQYPEVKVRFGDPEEKSMKISDGGTNVNEPPVVTNKIRNQILPLNEPPVVTNTIRNQILPLDETPFIRNLNASPRIFADLNGDALIFTAESNAPQVASTSIKGSTLTLSAVSQGNASITISASDGNGGMTSTTFLATVGEVDNWEPHVENYPAKQILTVGRPSFTRYLAAPPMVFKDVDGDSLTYTAISGAPSVVTATIQMGNMLKVNPIAGGSAKITISANDGKGGTKAASFDVVVIDQNLEWPKDDRLILLYQTDKVLYLYSRSEERVWHVRSDDIHSMVYYGRINIFES